MDERLYAAGLEIAFEEAQIGLAEGGIPVGAALLDVSGQVLGRGHNRRVQENDPSVHGETDAFRKAGPRASYRDTIMVTTLAPCWYCSGLIFQFGIGTVAIGDSVNFTQGGMDWLRERGGKVIEINDARCEAMMRDFIANHPQLWFGDIGRDCC